METASDRRSSLPLRLDRHDPVAGDALVDVHEGTQPDAGQLPQSGGVAAASFATWRAAFFCERSGHDGITHADNGTRRKIAIDCILIVEELTVRLRGSAASPLRLRHLLPPNRPAEGILETYCAGQSPSASALPTDRRPEESGPVRKFVRREKWFLLTGVIIRGVLR